MVDRPGQALLVEGFHCSLQVEASSPSFCTSSLSVTKELRKAFSVNTLLSNGMILLTLKPDIIFAGAKALG